MVTSTAGAVVLVRFPFPQRDQIYPTANEHLVNIYSEGEINPEATIRSFQIVQSQGSREVSRAQLVG